MGKGNYLGEFEELVMLAVAILKDQAYGVSVMDEIKLQTGRQSTISTVHETLIRLEKKGFLASYTGGATNVRGGRKKRYFQVTALGKKAMNATRDVRSKMWQKVPKLIWEGGTS